MQYNLLNLINGPLLLLEQLPKVGKAAKACYSNKVPKKYYSGPALFFFK